MPDLALFAGAYENGRTAGSFVVWLIIALVGYSVLRRWLGGRVTSRYRRGALGFVVVCVALIGSIAYNGRGAETDLDSVRAEMREGCEAIAGRSAGLCGCLVEEVLRRNGTSDERLEALAAEIEKSKAAGGTPPAVFTASAATCARQASAPVS